MTYLTRNDWLAICCVLAAIATGAWIRHSLEQAWEIEQAEQQSD
jgi:hypothetical protein